MDSRGCQALGCYNTCRCVCADHLITSKEREAHGAVPGDGVYRDVIRYLILMSDDVVEIYKDH